MLGLLGRLGPDYYSISPTIIPMNKHSSANFGPADVHPSS
jgi:hypothetical protein